MPPEVFPPTRKYVCRLCYTLSTLLHAAKSLHFAEASLFKVENLKKKFRWWTAYTWPDTPDVSLIHCQKNVSVHENRETIKLLSTLSFFVTMFSKGRCVRWFFGLFKHVADEDLVFWIFLSRPKIGLAGATFYSLSVIGEYAKWAFSVRQVKKNNVILLNTILSLLV